MTRPKIALLALALLVLGGCQSTSPLKATPETENKSVSEFLRTAAVSSQRANNYGAAVNYYQSLYARNPKDLEAVLGLARNLRYIGDTGEATNILEKALEDRPDDADLLAALGKTKLAEGKAQEALEALSVAAEVKADDWRLLSAQGIAYDLLGQYDDAQAKYTAALELTPNNLTVLNNLALSKALSGDLDGGVQVLRRASRHVAAGPQVRQNLALLYAMRGDLDRAELLLKQDLPPQMVRNNIDYYRRLFPSLARVQGKPGGDAVSLSGSTLAERLARAAANKPLDTPTVGSASAPKVGSASVTEAAPLAATETGQTADTAPAGETAQTTETPQAAETPKAGETPQAGETTKANAVAETTKSDATAESTAAESAAAPSNDATGDDGAVMVQLGVFPTEAGATQGLVALRKSHAEVLTGMRFEIAEPETGGMVVGYRLLAGPLASEALAADLCAKLHSQDANCTLTLR